MKIALVHHGTISPSDIGGSIEIWIYEVARRLARSCDVIVYSRRGFNQKKIERIEGVLYKRISTIADEWFTYMSEAVNRMETFLRLSNLRRSIFFHDVKRPLFASILYYLMYILQVARDLRSEKCDIVHLHNFSQFVSIIRFFNPRIKIVLHMHCEWLTQLDRTMIEHRLRKVELIIGCSGYITEKIRYVYPQLAERCKTVYNGVDEDRFFRGKSEDAPFKKGVKRLLFVSRVSPEKGLHILLDAFKKVVERYPQAQLEIVGPKESVPFEFLVALSDDPSVSSLAPFFYPSTSSYFSQLQKHLLSFNIANNVIFTGFIPHGYLVDRYREADILVSPSFSEAFGMSLIEAMACQVSVVATKVGGMKEIVEDGKTGLLIEPGDAPALAKAILSLLQDGDLRKLMGKAAHRRAVELFSWERIVEKLLCQYKNIYGAN